MPQLMAMLPVRNEGNRWLSEVLEQLLSIVDAIVVYDDASTDATPDICHRFDRLHYYRGDEPWFSKDESELRRHLWDLTVLHEPEWILALDADEIFEPAALQLIPRLIDQSDYDAVAFRIFDFWKGTTHVRNDGAWNPWTRFSPLLMRYDPSLRPTWNTAPIHCGRFPLAYRDRVTFYSPLRVRHYGWASGDEHLAKYQFYRDHDLTVYGKVQPHTESVLAATATVEPWMDLRIPEWLFGSKERQT